jgi:hypothetical protein
MRWSVSPRPTGKHRSVLHFPCTSLHASASRRMFLVVYSSASCGGSFRFSFFSLLDVWVVLLLSGECWKGGRRNRSYTLLVPQGRPSLLPVFEAKRRNHKEGGRGPGSEVERYSRYCVFASFAFDFIISDIQRNTQKKKRREKEKQKLSDHVSAKEREREGAVSSQTLYVLHHVVRRQAPRLWWYGVRMLYVSSTVVIAQAKRVEKEIKESVCSFFTCLSFERRCVVLSEPSLAALHIAVVAERSEWGLTAATATQKTRCRLFKRKESCQSKEHTIEPFFFFSSRRPLTRR